MKSYKDYPALIEAMNSVDWDDKKKESFGTFMVAIAEEGVDLVTIITRTHLYSEIYLNKIINKFFTHGSIISDSRRFTYATKLDILEAGDWLKSSVITSLKALNTTRNKCAHKFNYEVTMADIDHIGKPFGEVYSDFKKIFTDHKILLQNVMIILFATMEGQLEK